MPRRILFILTSHDRKGPAGSDAAPSGFYLSEVSHPYQVLVDAGYVIDFASPRGGRTHVDGLDPGDPVNVAFRQSPAWSPATENTLAPAQVDPDAYAAIFYAGGHATMWDLPESIGLAAIAARIYENGGVVAAVCHGPAGLVNVKLSDGRYLVEGKDVAAFTNAEERAVGLHDSVPFLLADMLEARGARHLPADDFQPHVVVSERLVTGQNPASAAGVAQAMMRMLDIRHVWLRAGWWPARRYPMERDHPVTKAGKTRGGSSGPAEEQCRLPNLEVQPLRQASMGAGLIPAFWLAIAAIGWRPTTTNPPVGTP